MELESNQSLEVDKHIVYHIIPFGYTDEYEEAINYFIEGVNQDSNGIKDWKYKKISKEQFFHHIEELISEGSENSTIGKRFVLSNEQAVRIKHGLPKNVSTPIKVSSKGNDGYSFKILEVELLLFETNVGFLIFNIEYIGEVSEEKDKSHDQLSIKHIIEGNYYFKKYGNRNINVSYEIQDKQRNKKSSEIDMKEVCKNILRHLNVETFFTEKEYPDNALVFSTVILKGIPEEKDIKKNLFELCHSFKDTYKEFYDEFTKESLRMFDNLYWGMSLEGVANIGHYSNDKKADAFIGGNYLGNIKATYFTMYILTLHKRYALLNYILQASKLSKKIECYLDKNRNVNEKNSSSMLFQLRSNVIFYKLRCVFNDLTNISHQARISDAMNDALRIGKLQEELENELESLEELKRLVEEKEKQKEDQAKDKFNSFLTIISVIIAIFAFVQCFDPIINIVSSISRDGFKSIYLYQSIILIGFLYIVITKYGRTKR